MIPPLPIRLAKAASLVGSHSSPDDSRESSEKSDVYVADIGCDHAYLSLHLILTNRCTHAIAADLRQGPLAAAQNNIQMYGCADKITAVLTDGLDGLDRYPITDIIICGMGGDTIMDILSRADFIKKPGMRLILQPQTAFAEVVLFLADAGFRIIAERYCTENKKAYRILCAEYIGKRQEIDMKAALVGTPTLDEDWEDYTFFCQKILGTIDKKIQGARASHCDDSYLVTLRQEILDSLVT